MAQRKPPPQPFPHMQNSSAASSAPAKQQAAAAPETSQQPFPAPTVSSMPAPPRVSMGAAVKADHVTARASGFAAQRKRAEVAPATAPASVVRVPHVGQLRPGEKQQHSKHLVGGHASSTSKGMPPGAKGNSARRGCSSGSGRKVPSPGDWMDEDAPF
jgi:hypothetical protein